MVVIEDIYRKLFGRGGTTKGRDISMAEHGRVGGDSAEQPFKFIRYVDERVEIDEVDSDTTYIGLAKMGADTSNEVWLILKITTTDTVTSIVFADGDPDYNNEWDERANLDYS